MCAGLFFPANAAVPFLLSLHGGFEVGFLLRAVVVADVFVDEDAAAVLTHDDFLAGTDVELSLGRDFVEAASAGITVDSHDGQAVAGIGPDAAIGSQQTVVDGL